MLNKKYKLARFKMKMMGFVRIVHLSKEKKRGVKQIVQLCNKVINVYQKEKIKNENPRNCRNSTSSQ